MYVIITKNNYTNLYPYRFGVCCLFIASAGGSTVTQNCSYIQNPSFPSAYAATTALSYTIAKCAAGISSLTHFLEIRLFHRNLNQKL